MQPVARLDTAVASRRADPLLPPKCIAFADPEGQYEVVACAGMPS